MTSPLTIRLAQPEEGPLVGSLVKAYGGPAWEWIDWSSVYPYWLIGEVGGTPRGVIMALPGRPFGFIDHLFIDPTCTARQKAVLARDLSYAALEACRQFGAQLTTSYLRSTDASWEAIATKRGWVPCVHGLSVMKRT